MVVKEAVSIAAFFLAACSMTAFAQDRFPSKPIHIIIPFAAGSSPDVWSRLMAKQLEPRIGQPIVVEIKPGANSTLGATLVAKSAPDGYTILYSTNSATSAAKALFKSLSYDPIRDFAALTIFQQAYFAFMVRPEEKGTTFAQFLDKMRKDPGRYPTAGSSSTHEILDRMMDKASGKIGHTYVRYANSGTMMTDVVGGRLGGAFHTISGSLPFMKSGQAHAIAVSSPVPLAGMLETPLMITTLPGVALGPWSGLFVPAKTPRNVINALYQPIAAILKEPAFVRWSEEAGRAITMTPEEANNFVREEEGRWTSLGRMAGIDPE